MHTNDKKKYRYSAINMYEMRTLKQHYIIRKQAHAVPSYCPIRVRKLCPHTVVFYVHVLYCSFYYVPTYH